MSNFQEFHPFCPQVTESSFIHIFHTNNQYFFALFSRPLWLASGARCLPFFLVGPKDTGYRLIEIIAKGFDRRLSGIKYISVCGNRGLHHFDTYPPPSLAQESPMHKLRGGGA